MLTCVSEDDIEFLYLLEDGSVQRLHNAVRQRLDSGRDRLHSHCLMSAHPDCSRTGRVAL